MRVVGLVERAYWWWMRRTSQVGRVRGIDFVYVSDLNARGPEPIVRALEEAFDRIARAEGGFGELVMDQLRFVGAVNAPDAIIASAARGYVSPFFKAELENPHVLACRLVYAATVVRLRSDERSGAPVRTYAGIANSAHEAQLRFVRQFPNAAQWEDWLEAHKIRFSSPPGRV